MSWQKVFNSPFSGRPESYWQERNALVDAVREIDPRINGKNVYAEGWNLPGAAELRRRYSNALQRLKDFDAEHGGTPVL